MLLGLRSCPSSLLATPLKMVTKFSRWQEISSLAVTQGRGGVERERMGGEGRGKKYMHIIPSMTQSNYATANSQTNRILLDAGHKLVGEEFCFESNVDECLHDLDVLGRVGVAVNGHCHQQILTLLAKLVKREREREGERKSRKKEGGKIVILTGPQSD